METEKGEEGTKGEQEQQEVEPQAEETQEAAPQEEEAAEESIPKRRYDELLARAKKQEEDLGKAVQYINAYIVNKQKPQAPSSVEDKLAALESRYEQLEKGIQYKFLKEQQESELVAEVESELEKRPYLREWAQEIYQAVAFDPSRSIVDIAKAFDVRLGKVGKNAVTSVVASKKAMANHATASSVQGKPPAPQAKKSAVQTAKNWDELEESLADSARAVRSAREGA